jgi:hypothetical protein
MEKKFICSYESGFETLFHPKKVEIAKKFSEIIMLT